jgi:hypothetical protein
MADDDQSPYVTLGPRLSDAEIEEALGDRERETFVEEPGVAPLDEPERPVVDWRALVSTGAYDFIVGWETGGREYYDRVIKGRPVWPGFSSGITIGCGYDIGYHTAGQLSSDWSGRTPAAAIGRLNGAIGFKTIEPDRPVKVERARELVRLFSDIVVPWDVAIAQFDEGVMPAIVGQLARALPNLDVLHPHCYGALLSLVFNRGTPFQNPAPRFVEMVEIHRLMSDATRAALGAIPAQFRAMARIWGPDSSLAKRRRGEADLFELGLRERDLLTRLQEPAPVSGDDRPAEG